MKKLIPLLFLFSCTEKIEIADTVITEQSAGPFTNVTIQNKSKDSVLVYLTIQAPNSVVGIFGINAADTIGSCSKGTFWAYADSSYTTNLDTTLLGAVISFGGDNLPCAQAIAQGFPTGINIFEFSINTPYEVFDLSCEDGMNSMLRVSVNDTVNWTTGDGGHIAKFDTARNVFPLINNVNIRGVFPYRCTDCKDLGKAVPENCFLLKDSCSTYRTCQVARTNHNGGVIMVQYLGGVPQICSKEKR